MTTEAVHPKCPPFFCRFLARTWCKFSYFTNSELTLGVKFIFIISLMHTLSDKVRFVQRKLKPEEAFTTKKWMVLAEHLLAQEIQHLCPPHTHTHTPINMPDLIWKHLGYSQLWPHCQHAARIVLDHLCLMQLPASNLVLFFQRRPGSYCAKLTRIQFGFGCLRFWPNGSNTSASWCASIIQPALATASKQSRTRCKSDPARPTGNQTFVPSLLLTPKAACPEARHVAEAGWPTPGPGHKSSSITITMQ